MALPTPLPGRVGGLIAACRVIAAGGVIAACGVDSRSFPQDSLPLTSGGSGGIAGDGATGDTAGAGGDNGGMGGLPAAVGGSGGEGPVSPPLAGAGPVEPDPDEPDEVDLCVPAAGAVPALTLVEVATGLAEPLFVAAAPGDATRLFVLEKAGTVRVIVDGQLQAQPFLDITAQVASEGERGLLGLAFHPDYSNNGLFYVHFSSSGGAVPAGDGVVAEFQADPGNPNQALLATQRQVLVVAQPQPNHNGGMLAFGPDGLLYLGFGDGGGANDAHGTIGNGQALDTLLGKLLRLDVNGRTVNGAYGIPAGNLAAQTGQIALPEIWAYGLRNPWRFSFDACNGDLYIADVGQNTLEEVDYLPAATPAGANFGWRIMEGPSCRPGDADCNAVTQAGLTLPVDSYARDVGVSITGGYVYRGSAIPSLRGHYIYADYASARFFRVRVDAGQAVDRVEITAQMQSENGTPTAIASFGQDNAGEIYVAAFDPGAIYRIAPAP